MFAGLLLSGTNDVSLDLKGRMAIPARYKDLIKDESDGQLIVTRCIFDKCLWIYPTSEWENVVESLGALPTITDPLCRTIQRIVLGSAVFCSLDAQGRILIPQELRTEASLEKKAFLIGFNNKFELWSEENFKAQREIDNNLLMDACKSMESHSLLANLKL